MKFTITIETPEKQHTAFIYTTDPQVGIEELTKALDDVKEKFLKKAGRAATPAPKPSPTPQPIGGAK